MESNDVQPGSFLAPSLQRSALDEPGISPRETKHPRRDPKFYIQNVQNENKSELREQTTTHMDAKANDDIQLHCQYLHSFIHRVWVSNRRPILTFTPPSELFVI